MDCLQGMKQFFEDEEVDVVVTSPPYNLGIKYNKYDDTISRAQYLEWMEEVGKECKRVLKDDGLLWLNWSELRLSLNRILVLFGNDWTELIRLHVTSPYQNLSSHRNYWVCFRKRNHHMSVSARSDDLDQWFGGARIC